MKEYPDSMFNMRRQFYDLSKAHTMKDKIVRLKRKLVSSLEEAKQIPNAFLIEEISSDVFQVWYCDDKEFSKKIGLTIKRLSGIVE